MVVATAASFIPSLPLSTRSMASQPLAAQPLADYPLIFRRYILRNLQISLEQVRQSGDTLAEAIQQQALHILDFALRFEESWPILCELLLHLSPFMERLGEYRRWLAYLTQALALCRRCHDQEAEARLTWTAGVLSRRLGDLLTAEHYLQQSQTLAAALLYEQRLRANALTELAHVIQMQHRLVEAKALIQQAHTLLSPDDPLRAPGYSVLGDVFFEEQNWAAAAALTEQAIALWNAHGQRVFAASGWRGLARIRWRQGDASAAVVCYERAIACYEASHEQVQQAITCVGLGGIYAGLADGAQALLWLAQAEQILLPLQDTYHLAMLYTNYGIAYRLLRQWPQAVDALHKSLAYAQELGDQERQVNGLTELATVYQACEQVSQARHTLIQAQNLLDQLSTWPDAAHYQALITQMLQTLPPPE
jgi:tetratricopeptide (TPR) repeat protein